MRIPDVNLLLFAVDQTSPRHAAARAWVQEALSGTDTVAFAWVVLLAFVRLSTKSGRVRASLSADRRLTSSTAGWRGPSVTVIGPTDRHASLLRELLTELGTTGNLTPTPPGRPGD